MPSRCVQYNVYYIFVYESSAETAFLPIVVIHRRKTLSGVYTIITLSSISNFIAPAVNYCHKSRIRDKRVVKSVTSHVSI